jgi:hypothetical protein
VLEYLPKACREPSLKLSPSCAASHAPRQAIYANARAHRHTKKEARRILKRHLSDVVHRRMTRDLAYHQPPPALLAA